MKRILITTLIMLWILSLGVGYAVCGTIPNNRYSDIVCEFGATIFINTDGTVEICGEIGRTEREEKQAEYQKIENWTDIVALAEGSGHWLGLKKDGTVVASGLNEIGECDVEDWTEIIAITAGDYHSVGLKADGTVVAVGDYRKGQCDVEEWSNIVAIAAYRDGEYTVGLRDDGTVLVAGEADDGPFHVEDWSNIIDIAAMNSDHIAGLQKDGLVVLDGKYADSDYRQTEDWMGIIDIEGYSGTLWGLKRNGTIECTWGVNFAEALNSWENLSAISAGYSHLVGIQEDGTILTFGRNDEGQLNFDKATEKPQTGNGLIGSVTDSTEEIPEAEIQNVVETTYNLLSKGSKGEEVKKLQNRLNSFGYSVGTVDGDYGNKTLIAIEQFQNDNGLAVTGAADSETQRVLFENEVNPCLADYGKEYISGIALDEISKFWNVSSSACEVGDVYCLDKENNTYHFAARIHYTKGSGEMGLGRDLIFKREKDGWTVNVGNEIKIYSKQDKLEGILISEKNTPVSEAADASAPKATTKPSTGYSESDCKDIALAYMQEHIRPYLKNPASLQITNVSGVKTGTEYLFTITYTAMNSFGGYTPGNYYCTVDYTTGKVTMGGII